MCMPSPGSEDPWETVFVVKNRSAKSSRSPKTPAHQAGEVSHPSQVPKPAVGSTAMVGSAFATRAPNAVPAVPPAAADGTVLRVTMPRLLASWERDRSER
jgi:hypothetical protein